MTTRVQSLSYLVTAALIMVAAFDVAQAKEGVLRAGIIGCDTSHVIAFTDLINSPNATGVLESVEVTVAYPGGSEDVPASRDRLEGYTQQLREKGIKIVDSLEELANECDVVLLESVDGRPHLEQFKGVARGKPVFVDKPAAGTLADVIALFRHAEKTHTPVFTSSSLRFADEVQSFVKDNPVGELLGCETTGPLHLEPHHPDLFWYGVHGAEILYTVMGRGCETVTRVDSDTQSVVVGKWNDGRIGSFRGMKVGAGVYGLTVYGMKGVVNRAGFSGYEPLVREICEFFNTGKPPVASEDSIELFAFMEAADESKRRGGEPVSIAEVMKKAEEEAAGK